MELIHCRDISPHDERESGMECYEITLRLTSKSHRVRSLRVLCFSHNLAGSMNLIGVLNVVRHSLFWAELVNQKYLTSCLHIPGRSFRSSVVLPRHSSRKSQLRHGFKFALQRDSWVGTVNRSLDDPCLDGKFTSAGRRRSSHPFLLCPRTHPTSSFDSLLLPQPVPTLE